MYNDQSANSLSCVIRSMYCWMMAFSSSSIWGCWGTRPLRLCFISESVSDMVRERLGEKPVKVVGLTHAQWVAMDYSDVIVHVFLPETRAYYNLEGLWEDARLTRLPDLD